MSGLASWGLGRTENRPLPVELDEAANEESLIFSGEDGLVEAVELWCR